jgi:hypothetical protein
LEPLGYIGYYSQLKMFDYPGLSSPEMVAARLKYGDNGIILVNALEPRWVVLRPGELYSNDPALNKWFTDHYALAKVFNAEKQISDVQFLPGRPYLRFDQTFLVLKRKD